MNKYIDNIKQSLKKIMDSSSSVIAETGAVICGFCCWNKDYNLAEKERLLR